MSSLPLSNSPLSSIVNPLDPKQVLLFYVTEKGRTGLEKHSFENEEPNTIAFADNGVSSENIIAHPGSFTALKCNGLVYGLVKDSVYSGPQACPTPTEPDMPKRIAQLSPVYKILESEGKIKALGVALTTTIDSKGQGWMYYIANDHGNTVINEVKLGWGQSTIKQSFRVKNLLLNTNLAAAYDPKQRNQVIIFQNSTRLRRVDSDGNEADVPNTDDSRDGTGIALVSIKTPLGVKLYLYYFSEKGSLLQRTIRDENGNWGYSGAVEGALKAEKSTFLTATYVKEDGKEGGKIVVFYIAAGKPKSTYVFPDIIDA